MWKTICNDALEDSFREMKRMEPADILLSYPDWKLLFLYTQMSLINIWVLLLVIIINILPFSSRRLIQSQRNYSATEKEILSIVEFLKRLRGILSGYEINLFSYHKNMVYAATLSEYQRVMRW